MIGRRAYATPEPVRPFTVRLSTPERWWVARRKDCRWLCDPDREDGERRYDDCDERNWKPIGEAASAVAAVLQTRNPAVAAEELLIVVDIDGLGADDVRILESWFAGDTGPCADPWSSDPMDGRHRLWNVWRASPRIMVPIYSELLGYPLGYDGRPRAGFADEAAEGLNRLERAVGRRSPLFSAALRSASRVAPRL